MFKTMRDTILFFVLLCILLLPTIQWLKPFKKNILPLYGYTPALPEIPKKNFANFLNRNWQIWIENYLKENFGFKPLLVRTFNEISFNLFHENNNPELKITIDRKNGLYSHHTINSLNNDLMHKDELEKQYFKEAKELLKIQNILEAQGKFFVVVIASSKAYIYPERLGKRYIFEDINRDSFKNIPTFGKALRNAGVNVIDSGPILRNFLHQTGFDTHSMGGLHWNFYAGCLIAKRILEKAEKILIDIPHLDCGAPKNELPPLYSLNNDGFLILNLKNSHNLLKATTHPRISSKIEKDWRPKIVFIGDSFSDQIRYAFKEGKIFATEFFYTYFRGRYFDHVEKEDDGDVRIIQKQGLADIANADLIILEMVDYNLYRHGYGFEEYFLNNYGK